MPPIIEADKLTKIYNTVIERIHALKGISFAVKEREFISVMGPSGAGKTTLLNIIGCLDNQTDGDLDLLGYNLAETNSKYLPEIRRKNIGFVFQEFFLIPTLSALENVQLPLCFNKKKNRKPDKAKAIELLKKVGLKHRLNHFPRELSGGEMQRVAIARALVNSPKIVLADEPTGNLDTQNSKHIFALLSEINKAENVTILVATHNVKLAHQTGRIIHLQEGEIKKIEKD